MFPTKFKIVTACFLAAGLVALAHQVQLAAQTPAGTKNLPPTLEDLTKLAAVVKPTPGENKLLQIPWVLDVNEGRRLAKEEKRPILLCTIFGELLEEC
ncbi:MAG TPA: hypothetical protein VKE98_09680 [Gemmataceae bacterium]|jgi:hypothetical protein|nr:hypothetical protein [Gemmataceae bacterium]